MGKTYRRYNADKENIVDTPRKPPKYLRQLDYDGVVKSGDGITVVPDDEVDDIDGTPCQCLENVSIIPLHSPI